MILDMAMGGSTNTVLHILAIAHEAGVAFSMKRIDALSKVTPNICKVSPASPYHIEDVARAGGIHTILGEIARGRPGLLDLAARTVTGRTLGENIADYDVRAATALPGAMTLTRVRPATGERIHSRAPGLHAEHRRPGPNPAAWPAGRAGGRQACEGSNLFRRRQQGSCPRR